MKRKTKSIYQIIILLFFLSIISIQSVPVVLSQDEDPYPRDEQAEWQVLTELNRWRIRRGLVPLSRNRDLDDLAYLQAYYMAPNIPFTDVIDFHTDQYGDGVFKRAELYGWPGYDAPNRVMVSEIAAYYPDIFGAINFWRHSPVHTASVQTSGFREAGVAVLRNKGWKLSYVVLGGRPNILPIMYDPARNVLFLSVDKSVFSDGFQPTRIRILDGYGNRLHREEWLPWSDKVRLPAGATNYVTVIQTDGILTATTDVDLYNSRVFPSEPTPIPTPTVTPTATLPPVTTTPFPPTPIPSPTPAARNDIHDIRLVYDDLSLTLINQSGRTLNLEPLVFVSTELQQSRTAEWLSKYSKVPISRFRPGYCMQAWSYELQQSQPLLPDDCVLMVSARSALKPGERFWVPNQFTVSYRGDLIASCLSQARECSFDIPER